MNTLKQLSLRSRRFSTTVAFLVIALVLVSVASADVPNRVPVRGMVPLPGTQQQELGNITFPAPYNVFEFLVTCGACHGGTVDQQAGHFGNWGGTSMASAARDPIFRAGQMIANTQITAATGQDGAGNGCFRCHSPNGWYSGRFDPALNGAADGSTMIHTILLSTDDEGVTCETCHRSLDGVTMKRADLDPMDAAWNLMAGIDDWPHAGQPYVDQDGDPTIAAGNPYGSGTLQIDDGMTYGGRYPGYVQPYWGDLPLQPDPLGYMGYSVGGPYTGQTYGVYPPGWLDQQGNPVEGLPAFNPDGTLPIQYDAPIGPPLNPNGTPCYQCQSVSLEHPTFGASFVEKPEMCGSCHDQTNAIMNNGMPVQRTYTEWKYSAYGVPDTADSRTCQSCHMPRLAHEYADNAPVTVNADPVVSGWFPYAKSRTNTAFHKQAGANRDLPAIMKELYPEVDFEVIGGGEGATGVWIGTGNDPRIFPGMLSTRNSMWDRNQRNTEITLQDGVDVQIVSGPTYNATTLKWEVQVKVINQTGHRIPSGVPDGRRMWIELTVKDSLGAVVYQSGYYDTASATLMTAPGISLNRALSPAIDGAVNAVMVYEQVTGTCAQDADGNLTGCTPSFSPLNDTILFDNRIPPYGFDYAQYRQAGVKFWNYDPATFIPIEESTRYGLDPAGKGVNYDLVTYTFDAPADAILSVRAEAKWQTLAREYMEYLRTNDTSTVRPQGPPRPWNPNYPLAPNYLADEYGLADVVAQMQADGWPVTALNDNWGGIAYAAWYNTGKGAPFSVAVADQAAAVPAAPVNVQVFPQCDPVTGACTGGVINPDTGLLEPYTQQITWDPVAGAEGYLVWIKYGPGLTTASWDKLAIVQAPATELINSSINVAKTYIYKVQAFNGAGYGPESAEVAARTPWDLPLPPNTLKFVSSTGTTISMSWMDESDNEQGWIVRRLDAPPAAGVTVYPEIARFDSTTGFGGVFFTDGDMGQALPNLTWANGYVAPQPGRCYTYVVEAYNSAGNSGWNINGPVMMCTSGTPGAPTALTATAFSGLQVDLAWTAGAGTVTGYHIERSLDGMTFAQIATGVATTSYSDMTVAPGTTYWYRVIAYNNAGDSPASNVAQVTTPGAPPAAPTNLTATPSPIGIQPPEITLTWQHTGNDELGFIVERAPDVNGVPGTWAQIGTRPQNATNYVDGTVAPNMTYWYRVAAFNANGQSAYATLAQPVVAPGQIPEAPADLRVTAVTKTSVSLSWTDVANNEQGYYVERSTASAGPWILAATLPASTQTWTNTGLTSKTQYYFRVQAYNADGVSAYSNVARTRTK